MSFYTKNTGTNILIGLATIGKNKKWLIERLAERGISIKPPTLTGYLNGSRVPKDARTIPEIFLIIESEKRNGQAKQSVKKPASRA